MGKKQTNKISGFTLIEAVVTLFILALMTGILLTGVSGARDRFSVRDSAQRFANDLRNMFIATSNGVKLQSTCVPDPLVSLRECSNYKMVIDSDAPTVYQTQVKGVIGATFSLLAGTQFAVSNDSEVGSTFIFPSVSVFSTGLPSNNGITTIKIESTRDSSIFTNVCVYAKAAVIVQPSACN